MRASFRKTNSLIHGGFQEGGFSSSEREKFQFIKSRYLVGGHPRNELFLDGELRCPAMGEYVNINPCPPHNLKIKLRISNDYSLDRQDGGPACKAAVAESGSAGWPRLGLVPVGAMWAAGREEGKRGPGMVPASRTPRKQTPQNLSAASPAPRMFRGRRSGAGRTLSGRHGVPGPVPAAASSFLAVRSGAEGCAQDRGCERRLPPPGVQLFVLPHRLPGTGLLSAPPETRSLSGSLPLRSPVVAWPPPLHLSIFLPPSSGDGPRSGFKCPLLPLTSPPGRRT